MTCDIEGLMVAKEIQELTLECKDTKAQAFGLPPHHQASEWTTGYNTIATNTLWDEPISTEGKFPLETTAVETTAMRKRTSNGAEPASTLHQHGAHIK